MNKAGAMAIILMSSLLAGCPHLEGCALGDGAYQTLCLYSGSGELLWGN
ncbi:hypothetical protein [Ketobacter alkanivorans]|nr:hypothetical protein [Ketobacter alkanivorans]